MSVLPLVGSPVLRYPDGMTEGRKLGGYCRVADAIVPVYEGEPCETCGALHGHYPGYVWNGTKYETIVKVNPIDPDYDYRHKPESHTEDGI